MLNVQINGDGQVIICWDAKSATQMHHGVRVVMKNGKTRIFPGTIARTWKPTEAPFC